MLLARDAAGSGSGISRGGARSVKIFRRRHDAPTATDSTARHSTPCAAKRRRRGRGRATRGLSTVPGARGRRGGYLAVKRRGFHVDEGGGSGGGDACRPDRRSQPRGRRAAQGGPSAGTPGRAASGRLRGRRKRGEGDAEGSGGGGAGERVDEARVARERNRRITSEGGHARPLRSSLGSCILCPGPPPMVYTYPFTFFSYRRFTDLPPHDIFHSPVGSFPCVRATVNVCLAARSSQHRGEGGVPRRRRGAERSPSGRRVRDRDSG